ncbi:hypothetical protein HAX54_015474 [Datura stramonium]|uniref:Uncharacterized protein n=1 Tax=Datura stramonium TaxID=4076 RepID=A0ABS8RZG9_DATST|nr:hypothetical protein [Datura stramonium]
MRDSLLTQGGSVARSASSGQAYQEVPHFSRRRRPHPGSSHRGAPQANDLSLLWHRPGCEVDEPGPWNRLKHKHLLFLPSESVIIRFSSLSRSPEEFHPTGTRQHTGRERQWGRRRAELCQEDLSGRGFARGQQRHRAERQGARDGEDYPFVVGFPPLSVRGFRLKEESETIGLRSMAGRLRRRREGGFLSAPVKPLRVPMALVTAEGNVKINYFRGKGVPRVEQRSRKWSDLYIFSPLSRHARRVN